VRAKQLADRAAGLSNRPMAVKQEQKAVQPDATSELSSAEASNEDVWSDQASSDDRDDAY
jgi:hypothetical protein